MSDESDLQLQQSLGIQPGEWILPPQIADPKIISEARNAYVEISTPSDKDLFLCQQLTEITELLSLLEIFGQTDQINESLLGPHAWTLLSSLISNQSAVPTISTSFISDRALARQRNIYSFCTNSSAIRRTADETFIQGNESGDGAVMFAIHDKYGKLVSKLSFVFDGVTDSTTPNADIETAKSATRIIENLVEYISMRSRGITPIDPRKDEAAKWLLVPTSDSLTRLFTEYIGPNLERKALKKGIDFKATGAAVLRDYENNLAYIATFGDSRGTVVVRKPGQIPYGITISHPICELIDTITAGISHASNINMDSREWKVYREFIKATYGEKYNGPKGSSTLGVIGRPNFGPHHIASATVRLDSGVEVFVCTDGPVNLARGLGISATWLIPRMIAEAAKQLNKFHENSEVEQGHILPRSELLRVFSGSTEDNLKHSYFTSGLNIYTCLALVLAKAGYYSLDTELRKGKPIDDMAVAGQIINSSINLLPNHPFIQDYHNLVENLPAVAAEYKRRVEMLLGILTSSKK